MFPQKGNTARVIPAEEADMNQVGLLWLAYRLSLLILARKAAKRFPMGATSTDITMRFNFGLVSKEEPSSK
jgi:hypothetical protein